LVGFRPASDGLHRYTVTIAGTNVSGEDNATVELRLFRRADEPVSVAPILGSVPNIIVFLGEQLPAPITFLNTGGSVTECLLYSDFIMRDFFGEDGLEISSIEDPDNGVRTCQIDGRFVDTLPNSGVMRHLGLFSLLVQVNYNFQGTLDADALGVTLDIRRREPPILANIATPVEVAPDATLAPIIFPNTGEDVTSCAGVALADTYADPTAAPLELTVDMVSDNGKMTCQITGTAPANGSMGVYGVQGTNSGGMSTATVTITVTE
nr:hypothetical protein [Pseudomonadota bacterium]